MNKYTKVTLGIIVMFSLAMFASLIPEQFPAFFGDWHCTDTVNYHYGEVYPAPHDHWGYRHWLFFAMGVSLFGVGFVRICDIIGE